MDMIMAAILLPRALNNATIYFHSVNRGEASMEEFLDELLIRIQQVIYYSFDELVGIHSADNAVQYKFP